MAKPLHERIISARTTDRVTITDLEALLLEVAAERQRFTGIFDQATDDSIRFELSEEDRDEAAKIADRAKRNLLAMSAAFDDLSAKLTAKRSSDEQQAKRAERDAIIAERDALAVLIRNEWPDLEARMVGLLHAVKENDAKMAAARIFEASAESLARGLPGNFYSSSGAVRRLTDAKLPSFADAHHLAWPSPKRLNLDAARDEMVRAKQRMYAEDAEWGRYIVTPPLNNRGAIPLMMRNGPGVVSDTPVIGRMTEQGVKDARNNGCTVSPATPSASIGLPAAAFMS
jgi:hypothetical protein